MTPADAITIVGFMWGRHRRCLCGAVPCDGLDGYVARRWNMATERGARLDWTVDKAIAYNIALSWFVPEVGFPLCIVAVALHKWRPTFSIRGVRHSISGRTHITIAAILLWAVSH
jgi:hypothetical protein